MRERRGLDARHCITASAIFPVLPSLFPGTPGLDPISDPFSWSWTPGLGRSPAAWLPGELATKPSERLTPGVSGKTTTKAPGKTPKTARKWVTKTTKKPATQSPATPTTKHSRGPGTQSPLRPTSRTTTALTTEAPHRPTLHPTATQTPRAPQERTSKTVTTLTILGPREMTSEATMKRIPLASTEPSEIPAEGSPQPDSDLAPSPNGSTAGGPGEWRDGEGES